MVRLDREIFSDALERVITAVREATGDYEAEQVAECAKVSDECVFISETGPIGVLYLVEDEDADEATLRIEDIRISDEMRGEGLGTSIISSIKDLCAEEGISLNLSANPMLDYDDPGREAAEERLIGFYKRLGFTDPHGDGNMVIKAGDAPVMRMF